MSVRLLRSTLPVVLLALAACGPVTPPSMKAGKTPRPVSAAAKSPSPSPTATPAPALLARPAGDVKVVTGVVRIDASYAVGAAGARLISNNGGTAVAAGGALVSNNTGNLISEHGGSLISDTGGSIISDTGGSYRLAEQPTPGQGEVLPAAGLVVAVRDLASGQLLSLGSGPGGKPVYEVLTNAAGGFELYVPANAGSLLLESRFPAASGKAADPRLQYDLLSDAPTQALVIDEDTAQVSRYARNTWKSTVTKFVLTDNEDGTVRDLDNNDNPLAPQVNAFVKEFHAEAVRVGLDKAPAAEVDALAGRIADTLIARVPLSQIVLSKAVWPSWTGPEEPAIPALVDVLRRCREATNAKLAADPGFFDKQDFLIQANKQQAGLGLPPYEIRKSTDLNELVMEEYLAKNKTHGETEEVFTVIGVDLYQSERMYAAVNNYIGAVTLVLLTDESAKAKAYELIRSYKPKG
jgi:hypothetical protein